MRVTVKELIERLEQESKDETCEFIIVKTNGQFITAKIEENSKQMLALLRQFESPKG